MKYCLIVSASSYYNIGKSSRAYFVSLNVCFCCNLVLHLRLPLSICTSRGGFLTNKAVLSNCRFLTPCVRASCVFCATTIKDQTKTRQLSYFDFNLLFSDR